MTAGSYVHDEVGVHMKSCKQCRGVDPERERIASAGKRLVNIKTLMRMCAEGRAIYTRYLDWLRTP